VTRSCRRLARYFQRTGSTSTLRWLSPSTAAIQASLRLNQAGAPLEAALWHLSVLLALALLGWVAVLWLGSRRADLPGDGRK